MGWSVEVHRSRLRAARVQAKRAARVRRFGKQTEPDGNSGPLAITAVAGLLISCVTLQLHAPLRAQLREAASGVTSFLKQLSHGDSQQQPRKQVHVHCMFATHGQYARHSLSCVLLQVWYFTINNQLSNKHTCCCANVHLTVL